MSERESCIGGSEIAAVVNLDPWQTREDVWRSKVGLSLPKQTTPDMERGKALESVAADQYAKETGFALFQPDHMRHPSHNWAGASIDRQVILPDGSNEVLEIKVPRLKNYHNHRFYGIPDYYICQGQWYCGISGWPAVRFWIFSAEEWQGFEVRIERDDQLIDSLLLEGAKFWETVENGVPDDSNIKLKVEQANSIEVVQDDTTIWARAITDYRKALDLEKEVRTFKSDVQDRIKGIMGDNQRREGAGARAYFDSKRSYKKINTKLLVEDLKAKGEDLSSYEQEIHPKRQLRIFYTKEKEV